MSQTEGLSAPGDLTVEDVFMKANLLIVDATAEIVSEATETRNTQFIARTLEQFKETFLAFHAGVYHEPENPKVVSIADWRQPTITMSYQHLSLPDIAFDRLKYNNYPPGRKLRYGEALLVYEDAAQPYVPTASFIRASRRTAGNRLELQTLEPLSPSQGVLRSIYGRLSEARRQVLYDRLSHLGTFATVGASTTDAIVLRPKFGREAPDQ